MVGGRCYPGHSATTIHVPKRAKKHRTVKEALLERRWISDIQGAMSSQALWQYIQLLCSYIFSFLSLIKEAYWSNIRGEFCSKSQVTQHYDFWTNDCSGYRFHPKKWDYFSFWNCELSIFLLDFLISFLNCRKFMGDTFCVCLCINTNIPDIHALWYISFWQR
jgi:hypothetical protein